MMRADSVTPSEPFATPPPSAVKPLPVWVGLSVFAATLVAAFGPTLWKLVRMWVVDPNYNHGFLVLPISIALAVRAYLRGRSPESPDQRLGWIAIAGGSLIYLTSILLVIPLLDFLALFFLLRGGLLLAGGRRWAGQFTFPVAFLLFMFPLPPSWVSYAALWLQDVAARVSETVLGMFVVCTRNGHSIRIAGMDGSLIVAEECSGTRQIVAFLALAALLGHLSGRSGWYKLCLFVVAIPVAVAANVLRVVLMNLGAYWFGTNWMGGWLHDAPALFSLPVGLVIFLAIDRALGRLFATPPASPDPDEKAGQDRVDRPRITLPVGFGRRWLLTAGVCLVISLIGYGLYLHVRSADSTYYPIARGDFAQIPLRFDSDASSGVSWVGIELDEIREQTRTKLPFPIDDLLYRGYQSSNRSAVAQVYMVHSRTGEDRNHHPEICIREVSGAPEDRSSRAEIRLSADGRRAQRFRFLTGAGRTIMVYYWHYSFRPERPASSPFQALYQRVGTSAPSITVQVTASGDDPTAVRLIEQTLLPRLDAAMQERVLPDGTAVGCDRTPIVLDRQ